MERQVYDVLGVGFGPSNIALAIALEENGFEGKSIFLEANSGPSWHGGMLISGSDIQNNPLRDLITPINPRSKYTFTNFLHESNRFFDFLNLGLKFPLRRDFADYVHWVAVHFNDVVYGCEVVGVETIDCRNNGRVWCIYTNSGEQYFAKNLVIGTGRKRNIPNVPGLKIGKDAIHLCDYLNQINKYCTDAKIVVVGSSQSAVEIMNDLHSRGYCNITLVHRSYSCRLKDTSPFSDEVYFPEYIDYYHSKSKEVRALLDLQTRQTNYSSTDGDELNKLYLKRYIDKLDGKEIIRIVRNTELKEASNGCLLCEEIYTKEEVKLGYDLVIFATGFMDVGRSGAAGLPSILNDVAQQLGWDGDYLIVGRNYDVQPASGFESNPVLFMNGLCESSHGLGDAGSFSLVSYRARDIYSKISRKEQCV